MSYLKVKGLSKVYDTHAGAKGGCFHALKDINFEAYSGDIIGIIGKNGSGKSTLLKIISGLVRPTTGTIEYTGNLTSLIEVGSGILPDLSGKQNYFLKGELQGLSKNELNAAYADMLKFTELSDKMDVPVKYLSSGMYMRLAFGFSIMMQADIYVFDEVLSVGDYAFQRKCFEKIQSLSKAGAVVLYVSHNLSELDSLANKYIWLENSLMKNFTTDSNILMDYINPSFDSDSSSSISDYEITKVLKLNSIVAKNGINHKERINNLSPILFSLSFKILQKLESFFIALQIKDSFGAVLFSLTSIEEKSEFECSEGNILFQTSLEGAFLNSGIYTCSLFCEVDKKLYDVKECLTFKVEQSPADTDFTLFSGSVRKNSKWQISRL